MASEAREILIGAAEAETGARCYFGAPLGQRDASLKLIEDALTQVGPRQRPSSPRSPTALTSCAAWPRRWASATRPSSTGFTIAMRIRHLQVSAAALPTRVRSQAAAKTAVCDVVERLHWKLWHGHPDAIGTGVKQIMEGLRRYRYEPHHARRPAVSRVAARSFSPWRSTSRNKRPGRRTTPSGRARESALARRSPRA